MIRKITNIDGKIIIDFNKWYYSSHDNSLEEELRLEIESVLDDFIKKLNKIVDTVEDYDIETSTSYEYGE